MRPDGAWHDIAMSFSSDSIGAPQVSVFEDGVHLFSWQLNVPIESITPQFHVQLLTQQASLSLDLADIYLVPSLFAPGVDTPWDFAFQENVCPPPEAMTFRTTVGGIGASFFDGYVRFDAQPLIQQNSLAFADFTPTAATPTTILYFLVRANQSEGSETMVTLPGGNILRILENGSNVSWQSFDIDTGVYTTWASSSIRVGNQDFTIVTLVTSANSISVLENGRYGLTRLFAFLFSSSSLPIRSCSKLIVPPVDYVPFPLPHLS